MTLPQENTAEQNGGLGRHFAQPLIRIKLVIPTAGRNLMLLS